MPKQDRLKLVPLFSTLPPETLALVASIANHGSYAQGSYLCRQGDKGTRFFVLLSGTAVLVQQMARIGANQVTDYLRPGYAFGEDALLLGDNYCFSVQASTDAEALYIEKTDMDLLLNQAPQIREQLHISPLTRERLNAPRFPWQDKDEFTILLRRRHWFAFARNLPIPLLVLFTLAAFAYLLRRLGMQLSALHMAMLVGIVPLAMMYWLWLDWRNDFYLLTQKRILHEEKSILLHELWDEAPLNKVQDTTIRQGLLGTFLGFGTLRVQTAGIRGAMVLDYLPHPQDVQDLISRAMCSMGSNEASSGRHEMRQALLEQTGHKSTSGSQSLPIHAAQAYSRAFDSSVYSFSFAQLFRLKFREGEQITWRKHWLFLARRTVLPCIAATTMLALALISILYPARAYSASLLLVSFFQWILCLLWLWYEVVDWSNDLYILTDRLIIDLERKPLFFSEERRQATLDMIQNVSLRKRGVASAVFNYGDVLIQTASATGQFTFIGVSDPKQVQREIFRRVEAYNEGKRASQREKQKDEISRWFGVYHELNPHDTMPAPES